ncbi:MAG: sigma-70 family RNA polymerase sigma factor [Burkholderiaceae bacterium]
MLDDPTIRRLLLTVASRQPGAAEAFERLYRACAPLLLGVAQRIVRRRELAEEVLHDAFVKIWRTAESFDPLGSPTGWMVAIVRNRALDLIETHDVARVDSYHDALDEDPDGALDRLFDWSAPADDAMDRDRYARWLRDCLAELAAVERQALVLAYSQGLSHADLAVHLHRPLGTIKTWIRRGMANLRDCVEACMGAAR